MRVLYDLSAHFYSKSIPFHGGSEYSKTVLSALTQHNKKAEIFGLSRSGKLLDPFVDDLLKQHNIDCINWEGNNLKKTIKEYKINKLYSPYPFSIPGGDYSNFQNFEYIFTIHGVRHLILPYDRYELFHNYSMRNIVKYLYKRTLTKSHVERHKNLYRNTIFPFENKRVITVSEHSKYSLLNFFPDLIESSIDICYSPLLDYSIGNTVSMEDINKKKNSYYLIVSAGIWEKNSYRAIKAFDELLSQNSNFKRELFVLGLKSNLVKNQIKNKAYIHFLPYQSREKIEKLYKDAYSLLYPSLSEGFGYPPLEAMKYGTLVLSSGIAPMTEICGTAAVYFNPYSIEDIKVKLLHSHYSGSEFSFDKAQMIKNQYIKISSLQKEHLDKLTRIIIS